MAVGAEQGSGSRGSVLGRVLRDRAVRSALGAGLVIGLSAVFSGGRYPWPFAVIGVVWLVATVLRIRDVVTAARAEEPDTQQGGRRRRRIPPGRSRPRRSRRSRRATSRPRALQRSWSPPRLEGDEPDPGADEPAHS
ncbi:MAG: hypothetical protein NVV66_12250 [Cellulomonas sp.]|uniref:hypothetical protein n=1 Tax=Cellulomonas sp. TaxID=40001 RepID=UPI00258B4CE1|nr:hypothetical protein [Cellulomonas sp.]MCR6705414.1 hypothetical protein [Cellulomonas sp.]